LWETFKFGPLFAKSARFLCDNLTLIIIKFNVVLMSLFDKDLALKQAGGNAELAKELFEMLVKDLPISLELAKNAHRNLNKDLFWDAIHKIHGGTAYCGVPDLKSSCKLLEDEIKLQYPSQNVDIAFSNFKTHVCALQENADKLIEQIT